MQPNLRISSLIPSGLAVASVTRDDYYADEGSPFIRIGNVTGPGSTWTSQTSPVRLLA